MKVIVFTGDENQGGIMQFTLAVVKTFQQMGNNTILMLPDINRIDVPEDILISYKYKKVDHVFPYNKDAALIAKKISNEKPDFVYFTDASIISIQVLKNLAKECYTCMTIHDIARHPMHLQLDKIKRLLVLKLAEKYVGIGVKAAKMVVLLSNNSLTKFCELYPRYRDKAMMFKLGAHPPISEPTAPEEMIGVTPGYLLFFGRIEKYKGILRLAKAYNAISQKNIEIPKLVIAGAGTLLLEEKEQIDMNPNVVLINRFISDSELVWLFQNCKLLVAPYIEASQSGVIPLAYYYGKPVIGSNIPGIKENVIDKTGSLFDMDEELMTILIDSNNWDVEAFSNHCKEYLNDEMNWEASLRKLVERIQNERGVDNAKQLSTRDKNK